MAVKKDFTGINTGRVFGTIETATAEKGQQGTASLQEQQERAEKLQTQGRKGCKLPRVNMAFTPENHEFIKIMASVTGQSMTQFTNIVIERYRNEHPELYEQAKVIKAQVKKDIC